MLYSVLFIIDMNDLLAKLERLVNSKAINIDTKETGRCRHKCSRILPLGKQEQPKVGDFCRSIVVGKDQSRKELILHITFLLDGEKATYVNHLRHKGYIRDYDLKEEFSIFTYIGNFKQIALGSELVAQVRSIVLREQQTQFEFTLKCKRKQEGHFRAGVTRDQIDVSQRDWRIYEKYGCFSGTFLAQYEEDFANPGLPHRLCKELRVSESESLDVESLLGALSALSLDYQRLIFAPGEAVGRQALHGGAEVPQSREAGHRAGAPQPGPKFRQAQLQDLHRPRMRPGQHEQLRRGAEIDQGGAETLAQQQGSPALPGGDQEGGQGQGPGARG